MRLSEFFMSATHRAAVDGLLKHVAGSFCSAVVYGAAGTGKTAVLDIMAARLAVGPKRMIRVTASAASLGLQDFTAQVVGPPRTAGLADQDTGETLEALTAVGADGTRIVLVVDGAETLLRETLDCIQLACKMQPLLQVVFSGRPEFEARLAGAEFSFLRRRVTHTFTLSAFSTEAAAAFVEHRLRSAGLATENLFGSDAFEMLLRHGAGNPGRIGDVLDRALAAQPGRRRGAASPNPPRRQKGVASPALPAQGAAFRRPPKLAALALIGMIAAGWVGASMMANTAAKKPSQAEAVVDPPAAGLVSPPSQRASRQPVGAPNQTTPERTDPAATADAAPEAGPEQELVAVGSPAEPPEPETATPAEQQAATPATPPPVAVNSPSVTVRSSSNPVSSVPPGRTPVASAPRPTSSAASPALGPERAGPRVVMSAAAPDGRRCRDVVLKMQLGENPSDADKRFLRSGCRSDR